ncbi:MAG: hypothetical protein WCP32_02985 [Bacteroidota bacterium]
METLSNILASFDVFQVFFNSFQLIADPIAHAFQQIFATLYPFLKNMFSAHPGLTFGVIVFIFGYITLSSINLTRRFFSSSLTPIK